MLKRRNGQVVLLSTVLLASAGCDQGGTPRVPTTPFTLSRPAPPPAPAPPPPRSDAIRVVVGQTLEAVVTPQHTACNDDIMSDAPDPCQPFVVDVPADGFLTITVGWPRTGTWLVLRVKDRIIVYGTDSLAHRLFVHAAESVTFSVGLHQGGEAQPFTITTALGSTAGPPGLFLTPGGGLGATITGADFFVGEDDLVGRCHHTPCRIVSVASPTAGYMDIRLWWANTTNSVLALYVPTDYAQSDRYCCEPSRTVTVPLRSGANFFVVGFERAGTQMPPSGSASEYFQIETTEVRPTP